METGGIVVITAGVTKAVCWDDPALVQPAVNRRIRNTLLIFISSPVDSDAEE